MTMDMLLAACFGLAVGAFLGRGERTEMPIPARELRKRFPKQQAILDGVFDEDELQVIREAQDDATFDTVDVAERQYCCPACGYGWNGNPRPNAAKEKK